MGREIDSLVPEPTYRSTSSTSKENPFQLLASSEGMAFQRSEELTNAPSVRFAQVEELVI